MLCIDWNGSHISKMKRYKNINQLMSTIQNKIDTETSFADKLILMYPDLFPKDASGKTVEPECGCHCPVGWESLVDELCSCIDYHVKNDVILKQKRKTLYLAYSFIYNRYIRKISKMILTKFDPSMLQSHFTTLSQLQKLESKYPIRYAVHRWLRSKLSRLYPKYKYNSTPIPSVCISQIKQKFGTLRFYYSGGDDVIKGMVMLAESKSGKTCEIYGTTGSLHAKGRGYKSYKTLSPEGAIKLEGYTKHNENI